MHELQVAFAALIASPSQQALFERAGSVESVLAQLRLLWRLHGWGDARLIQTLEQLSKEAAVPATALLAGGWLPHRYEARTRSIQWCLPDGPATEPFHDEYISRCLQRRLLNQFIRPRTPLAELCAASAPRRWGHRPAGFIFHLSRCGSTLVSGSLSELDSTLVLSEPPVFTELLLDTSLDRAQKREGIAGLVSAITVAVPGRHDLVVKWNAWDIFQWELLQDLYPEVPSLMLVRDPVEILASHHRQAGRHMSGDPSLAGASPVFCCGRSSQPFVSMLDHRMRVLQALMERMRGLHESQGVPVLHYSQLGAGAMEQIARRFGLHASEAARQRIAVRLSQHAKALDQRFSPDGQDKAAVFGAGDRQDIEARLGPLHAQLLQCAQPLMDAEALHAA
ncbi:sulfotransferase family protein [Delftia lacustris]|jgi:hypothetical protein|uniref:hypothetical protein n=1 Tax=Delftia TaxID=80865 RepID=UPI0004D99C84|nr:hypothetical protein [Delftia lacustris]KEH08030.1 hypothetical protein GY14_22585 [Delftia tsuruhatensis]QRI88398.1 sulfotransferase family protein [Delftia lacustris]